MDSWLPVPIDSDFSLQNLPYGVFSTDTDPTPRIGVAVGDHVLDLKVLTREQVFKDINFDDSTLQEKTLNAYAGLGQHVHSQIRKKLQELLRDNTQLGHVLRDNHDLRQKCLVSIQSAIMHLPVAVGDFTDFFVGLHHANNCAEFLKPGADITQVLPSFWDIPSGFHGRSSSVVVSGTPIHRPKGQYREGGKAVSGTSRNLDFEVEFGVVIGQPNQMGEAVPVDQAEGHIFGFVLLNDWSARDFQKWEPSAPFTCKNFGTSISPWIVPFEALEPFRVSPIKVDRPLPDYLMQKETKSIFEVPIRAILEVDHTRYAVAECNTKFMVFSFAQMIAHHTRGGCPLRPGDIMGTGTMSGPTKAEEGCFLELSRYGEQPYEMSAEGSSGERIRRTYLEDGDIVEFAAQIRTKDGLGNVGFGICRGEVLPAN
ncbi:fumarylacetoacetase [Cladophialophora bantiana CBS 173.52]|uniref:Fumarylacetoacetase n=1 Tax=Cladophialophora bantiana (strain ATCC 10958 / CBS 173.52 / CDC B-1940 / NIH 8579) TaxID=1442370 RepID=A0A0D2G5G8_CLAB1|nr:fumarylacetoacetase [Cladophialophora bantiana CBS 173.52]KIW93877.1 fumarylacetoacetase [Cladophialophora bantiana CBS 173.52]